MSPRSEEFMAVARDRTRLALAALAADSNGGAVSAAYYAMLNAARAALSEENRYAKTHSGTWTLFRETFVVTQRFDADLVIQAERAFELRIGADYDAERITRAQAEGATELAARFVAAIEALYAD
ncbi:MAG TPA: HEPN domain-containing protein [Gaiellaceae bacterium]